MEATTVQGLTDIAQNSNNDIIKLIVVLVLSIPLVILYMRVQSKERHTRHKEQMEREKLLVGVISDNTTAFVKLSTLLESNNQNCIECKAEQTTLNKSILDAQKEMHLDIIKIKERI